ncbi:MAG: hypothetical protein HQL17_04580 [Candidatus Omnitrophica bacterium]|nr:hypothetical protein [Candidatus Omnitrophota bacterium]
MFKRIQRIVHVVSGVVQKVLTTVLLVVLYIVGFGITAVFLRILKRDLMTNKRVNHSDHWLDAEGYGDDHDESLRQA